jgi:sulfite exporter TauE/SafE
MELLQKILDNSQYAFLTAAVLGLMTAISPCPLATNISAIGYISRDLDDRRRVFLNGLVYTLGRAITYVAIALIIFFGAGQMDISGWFQRWGEKMLGPALIIIGLFMLDFIRLRLPGSMGSLTEKIGERGRKSYLGTLLLGMLFAMAFCPYSGVLYFVMLIPMTVTSAEGLYLPLVFAVATGIPVIIFAWLLAYAAGHVGKVYSRLKTIELWFRKVVAVLFIGVGIWYIFSVWL